MREWSDVTLTLRPAEPISVEVLDAAGIGVADATVRHIPRLREIGVDDPPLESFERFVSEDVLTDSNGHAELARFPGEQVLWAEKADLISHAWQGVRPTRVVLVLEESLTIAGNILFPDRDQWRPGFVGERRIIAFGWNGIAWKPLGTQRDVKEGEWGPLRVPLRGFTRYRVRLEGTPIIPQETIFEPPRRSRDQRVDFIATSGAELYLFVENEASEPLTTARAVAWWGPDPSEESSHAEGASRPDGYLHLGTFPPGWINYRVSAPGYGLVEGDCEVPSPTAVLVTLPRGGRIAGHCSRDSNPVQDFEILYWKEGNPRKIRRKAFFDREDGRFELESLGAGDWSVTGTSASSPAGEPVTVATEAGVTREVEIALPEAIPGVGRVLDAHSGEPVPTAWVQPHSSSGGDRSFPWGAPGPVDPDGVFEINAFVAGANFITIGAEGYATAERKAVLTSDSWLDWGEVRLYRPQKLTVSLLGLEELQDLSATDLRARMVDEHLLPEKYFDQGGVVRYEGIPPGDHQFLISYPDNSWARLQLRLDPGARWDFDLEVAGERHLDVQVEDREGKRLSFVPLVLVAAQEENGVFVVRARNVASDGHALFEGIRASQAQVWVLDSESEVLATRDVPLIGGTRNEIEVHIGDEPMRVHVVDGNGSPLAGAWVTIRSLTGAQVHSVAVTGSDGWASLFGIPKSMVLLDATHGIAGRRLGVGVDGAAEELEIVLEARGSIELLVSDGDSCLSGVVARLETTGGVTLSEIKQTDDLGLVRFEPLGGGNYRFGCRRSDCWPTSHEQTLDDSERLRATVQMRRLADVRLTVLGSDDLPISGQTLELGSVEFGTSLTTWLAEDRIRAPTGLTADASGRIEILGLPNGEYTWSAEVDNDLLTGSFVALPDRRSEITVYLSR